MKTGQKPLGRSINSGGARPAHVAQRGTLPYRRMASSKSAPAATLDSRSLSRTILSPFLALQILYLRPSNHLRFPDFKMVTFSSLKAGNFAPEPLAGSPFALASRSDKLLLLT
jgi:hypothetical protein